MKDFILVYKLVKDPKMIYYEEYENLTMAFRFVKENQSYISVLGIYQKL